MPDRPSLTEISKLDIPMRHWILKCQEDIDELKFALKETHEMMQSFYSYYASEFRISTDPPDTEYELRVEMNEKLLGMKK